MDAKEVVKGLEVELVDAPETHGTVLTRAGMRVRLDLSASGGSPSKWLQVTDITPRGGARAPAPEPASAPAPVQPAADEPEEGTPVKEEPTEQVTPAKPVDKPEEKASEPANEEPKELAPWQKEARTPAKDRPKPSASPKVAETPALPSIGDLSAVPSDQKDSQLEKDRESAMDAIRAVAQAAADQAQDPFKAAVAALKEAATEDSKYKKAAAGDKATLVVEVISQYSRALRIAGVAQESSKVKTGVKTALKGKVDTVQARFEKLKAEVPLQELEQLEERLQEEGAKAAALLAADFDEQLSQAMSDWENQWKQAWVAVHGEESTATPTTKAKRGTGKGPPKVPKGSGKAAKAKSKPKPEPEPEPESESDDAEEAEEAEEPEEPEEAEAVEQVDDATADADVDAGTASVGYNPPTRTKIELPEMTRGVSIQAPKYNPPPRMEHGLLYEVGDSRIYLESTVLKPLEKALKDLSLARPQSAAHYLGNHMAGNDIGEKKELDPHTHLVEALNFDYFESIAPLVTKALSQVNKERPASKEEAARALSRALLSVGQDMPAPQPVAKSAEAAGARKAEEYEDGLEPDSLDEDDEEQEDDA